MVIVMKQEIKKTPEEINTQLELNLQKIKENKAKKMPRILTKDDLFTRDKKTLNRVEKKERTRLVVEQMQIDIDNQEVNQMPPVPFTFKELKKIFISFLAIVSPILLISYILLKLIISAICFVCR